MQFSIVATLAALVASASAIPLQFGPGPVIDLNAVFFSRIVGNYTGFPNPSIPDSQHQFYISGLTINQDSSFDLTLAEYPYSIALLAHPHGNATVTGAHFVPYSDTITDFVANVTLGQVYDVELWPNHPDRLNLFDVNGNKIQYLYRVDGDGF